jgi:hypothetical protein
MAELYNLSVKPDEVIDIHERLKRLATLDKDIRSRIEKGEQILFGDELFRKRSVVLKSIPEVISQDDMYAYHLVLTEKTLNPLYEEWKEEINERIEESRAELELKVEELEKQISDQTAPDVIKAKVLETLRSICSPDAYDRIAPIVEQSYK